MIRGLIGSLEPMTSRAWRAHAGGVHPGAVSPRRRAPGFSCRRQQSAVVTVSALSHLSRWWSDRRRFKRLHRTSEELLDHLDLPTGSGLSTLIERLSHQRNRPIHVIPTALGAGEACGIWLATDTVDIIVVESDTTAFHQDHIIAHELAHMLCAHSDILGPERDGMTSLFPHLDVQRIIKILGRTSYPTEDEEAAEIVASLILERVTRPAMEFKWTVPSDDAATVARIDQSLRPPE